MGGEKMVSDFNFIYLFFAWASLSQDQMSIRVNTLLREGVYRNPRVTAGRSTNTWAQFGFCCNGPAALTPFLEMLYMYFHFTKHLICFWFCQLQDSHRDLGGITMRPLETSRIWWWNLGLLIQTGNHSERNIIKVHFTNEKKYFHTCVKQCAQNYIKWVCRAQFINGR